LLRWQVRARLPAPLPRLRRYQWILVPEIAVAEKILRSVIVYGLLLVAFRWRASGRLSARKASRP